MCLAQGPQCSDAGEAREIICETKLFNFHRIFKKAGREGVQVTPFNLLNVISMTKIGLIPLTRGPEGPEALT